jgi:hypothetical protein
MSRSNRSRRASPLEQSEQPPGRAVGELVQITLPVRPDAAASLRLTVVKSDVVV